MGNKKFRELSLKDPGFLFFAAAAFRSGHPGSKSVTAT
jgi:hypothetical protein